jgi:predicted molibdopterin-dependent oxidoreductase YjgC
MTKKESEYIIYRGNPINQFNEFTARANQLKNDIVALYISSDLGEQLGLGENQYAKINANGTEITLPVKVDSNLIGGIPYVATFDKNSETRNLFENCRFATANITKV